MKISRTHCRFGHELTGSNVLRDKRSNAKTCKRCKFDWQNKLRATRNAEKRARSIAELSSSPMLRRVPGFPDYFARNDGKIFSMADRTTPRALSARRSKSTGYVAVGLYKDGKIRTQWVHRLIAISFLGPVPKGKEVAHLDGSRTNNRVENLAYVTRKINHSHKKLHGTHQAGEKSGQSKLTATKVKEIRRLFKRKGYYSNAIELANKYGIHVTNVWSIVNRKTWTTIE